MSANTPARKPTAATSITPTAGLRKPSSQTTPGRSTSPAKPAGSPQVLSSNGLARSPSSQTAASAARPVRGGTRRPGSIAAASGQIAGDQAANDDAKAENAALIEGLKASVRSAETASDDYQKQLAQTESTVEELRREHARMEERLQEVLERNEELEQAKKEATRQLREAGSIYESEKAAMLRDREEAAVREDEMRNSIKSLKDKLAGRGGAVVEEQQESTRTGRPLSRDDLGEGEAHFAPTSTLRKPSSQRSDSKSTSRLVMQKDQLIESLRLELAEAQIKLVEMENRGGGRMAELEKTLLETRMTNARLMEDNESYQLLLGEKTMNGELAKSEMLQQTPTATTSSLGSLAEELETAESNDERVQQLTLRVKVLEDEKKALTLYIDKMLTKIMNSEKQESILDKNASPAPSTAQPAAQEAQPSGVLGGLSRSLSVFSKRQRPVSLLNVSQANSDDAQTRALRPAGQMTPTASASARSPPPPLGLHHNPTTAPSIPLGRSASVQARARGHRRTHSAASVGTGGDGLTAGSLPPSLQRQVSGSRSPAAEGVVTGSSGPSTPRNSFFSPSFSTTRTASSGNTPATGSIAEESVSGGGGGGGGGSGDASTRPSSSSIQQQRLSAGSGTPSFASNENAETMSVGAATSGLSPPRGTPSGGSGSGGGGGGGGASGSGAPTNNYTGAVMTQNKLRPLRLVQQGQEEKEAEEAARKRANRASWMGWFNRGQSGEGHQVQGQGQMAGMAARPTSGGGQSGQEVMPEEA